MIVKFDLSDISDTTDVSSAKLRLYVEDAKDYNEMYLNVITSEWDADVTWNNRTESQTWNTPGGDYDPQKQVTINADPDVETWEEYDVTTFIQDFLQGNYPNYGFLVRMKIAEGIETIKRYYASSDTSIVSLRPHLVIESDDFPDSEDPVVTITSPDGHTLAIPTSHTITWTASDDIGVVERDIFFSSDDDASWTPVSSDPSNTGSYSWTVPTVESSACKVMMNVYDGAGNCGTDTTDNFTIADLAAPSVTIITPGAGEQIGAGTTYEVTWTATDNIGVVAKSIYYRPTTGSAHVLIDSASGNTGSYQWNVLNAVYPNFKLIMHVYDAAGNHGMYTTGGFQIVDLEAPVVAITSPAAGENVTQGAPYNITWTATDNIGVASRAIHFSSDGTNWTLLDSAGGNTGTYEWAVPLIESSACKVKINVYDAAGNPGSSTTESFNIVDINAPVVAILTPTDGEDVKQGEAYNITWTAENRPGVVSRAIHFTSDGTNWTLLDSALGNTGNYEGTVPLVESSTCKLRIYAYDASGNRGSKTTESFSVVDLDAPVVAILTPAAGDNIPLGSAYNITWTAENRPGVVSRAIYFCSDGTTWTLVDSALGNTGTFEWTVPTVLSSTCQIRIFAYDGSGNQGSNTTGAFNIFDLLAPVVTVLTPTAEDVLKQDSTYDITWTATDNVGVTLRSIYLSSDSGIAWTPVESADGNTGAFEWAIPTVTSIICLIKVFAYDASGNVGSQVSGAFTIEPPTSLIPDPLNNVHARYKVTITNLQGRKIASFETNNLNIDSKIRRPLSSGMHIVHVKTAGKKLVLRKCFIK